MTARSWGRRNGWWLLALPIALALAVAGNAHRVNTFWWENGYHREIAAGNQGQWVEVTDAYTDPYGDATRRFSVRFAGFEELEEVPFDYADAASPPGMQGYLVELDFKAAPTVPMKYCHVTVIDDQGDKYGGPDDEVDTGYGCVPADGQGPDIPFSKDQERGVTGGSERPGRWTVRVPVLLREDARPAEIRLAWDWNDYTTLRVTEEHADGD